MLFWFLIAIYNAFQIPNVYAGTWGKEKCKSNFFGFDNSGIFYSAFLNYIKFHHYVFNGDDTIHQKVEEKVDLLRHGSLL